MRGAKQFENDLSVVDFAMNNRDKRVFVVGCYAQQLDRDAERTIGILIGRNVSFIERADGRGRRIALNNGSSIYFRCDDDYLRGYAADRVQTRGVSQESIDRLIRPMLIATNGELEILS